MEKKILNEIALLRNDFKEKMHSMQIGVNELKEGQEHLIERVEKLEKGQEHLKQEVNELKEGQKQLKQEVNQLKEGQEHIIQRVENLEKGQELLHNNQTKVIAQQFETNEKIDIILEELRINKINQTAIINVQRNNIRDNKSKKKENKNLKLLF